MDDGVRCKCEITAQRCDEVLSARCCTRRGEIINIGVQTSKDDNISDNLVTNRRTLLGSFWLEIKIKLNLSLNIYFLETRLSIYLQRN